jgi:cold shock CspA family protein
MSPADEEGQKERHTDLFHHGVISKLFPSNNMGLLRTESGREVPFSFQFVELLGEAKEPADLREGQEVGYDLGWTSKGLRATKIKTFPEPTRQENSGAAEGQATGTKKGEM